jgi:thiol-disulfide isomerase/thioredoxin
MFITCSNLKNTIVVTGLLAGLFLSCSRQNQDTAKVTMPVEFSLQDMQGHVRTLKDFSDKQLIIIDFWATWCGPCRATIPHLNAFYKKHQATISIIGISIDDNGSRTVAAFLQNTPISYPVLVDGAELAKKHRIASIPTLLVVAPGGTVVRTHVGALDEQELETLLAQCAI